MAVGSGIPYSAHTGNGVSTVFAYGFTLLDADDLVVTIDGVSTSAYTVSGIGVAAGGSVTFSSAPASGAEVLLQRVIQLVREAEYQTNGDLQAETVNGDFDRLWMAVQGVDVVARRTLRAPFPEEVTEIPSATSRALQLLGFDADGEPIAVAPTSGSAADLALSLASPGDTKGDAMIAVKAAATGAQATTQHEVNERELHLHNFLTAAQIADIAAGTRTLDASAAVQAAIAEAESDAIGMARELVLPSGVIRLDAAPIFTKQYIKVRGAGMFGTQLHIQGATDGLKCQGLTYWRPTLSDFSVIGGASSLHALNMSGAGTVYNAEFRNLYLVSGDVAFYGGPTTILFSAETVGVIGGSYSGHWMHTNNGPSANFRGCYGFFAGAGKALYRMAGNIHLDGCNGGNAPGYDWWGVFGNDTASADGFEADFATADYPDVNLVGCNVEYFASRAAGVGGGLRLQTQTRGFQFIGGKIDRDALSTGYEAVIYARQGMNGDSTPFVLQPAWFQPGAGTPSLAALYCATTSGHFLDANGQLAAGGVTTCRRGANTYPTLKRTMAEDVYLGTALQESAISPRRLSLQMVRYKTVTRTPVGAGQAIDVTGYSKVIVTPAAAASITTATFTATAGADLDAERNGELVIEAGNANLTINHTARGGAANTFIMTGGSDVTLAAGQLVRFLRSETGSQWQQV